VKGAGVRQANINKPRFILFLLLALVALWAAASHAIHPTDSARNISLDKKPFEIHHKDAGWAEFPSLAVDSQYAYIAYDVREGHQSHIYLARVSRATGEIAKTRVDIEGEIEFWPSIVPDSRGGHWVVWTSYRGGQWAVRASYVAGMAPSPEVVLAGGSSLLSQVIAAEQDGTVWFVWVEWSYGTHRIMLTIYDEEFGRPTILYASPDPINRIDLYRPNKRDAVIAWDEYIDGRFVTRMREIRNGRPQLPVDLSRPGSGHAWEPHVVGSAERLLAVWHKVPEGSDKCWPAAAIPGVVSLEDGIGRESDRETWRVRSLLDNDGNTWIVWLTRFMYRNTRLYLRKIDDTGMSEVLRVEFPMRKNFINWFDLEADGPVVIAWEYSGGIYLGEFSLPRVRHTDFAADTLDTDTPAIASETDTASAWRRYAEEIAYVTTYGGEDLRVYFGDYHNHTSFSDGRAYPDIAMAFGRDWRGLDFLCVTDHDITLTPGEFAWNNTVADMLSVDDTYICLHGYEPSKGWAQQGFGHWNLLFPESGDVFQFEDGMTPEALFAYTNEHDAVLIPHHVGIKFAPYNWDYFDETAQPVVELCSIHGIFETYKGHEDEADMVEGKFIEDGLDRKYRFGFVAASDFHNCFEPLSREYGLTGVYATGLTKDELYDAIKKRRTFALTGGRIVVDFRCNDVFMGEEVQDPDGLAFTGYAASPDSIVSVEVISNREVVFEQASGEGEISFTWEIDAPDEETYYYLRTRTLRGDYAWSSPIWIVPTQ
jgi:hypothetical protein